MEARHRGARPRAAIYCRISSDREGLELGVERQQEDCRDLAVRHGLTVVEVFVDNDVSASTKARKERPEYRRMLADAREGRFDTIVAYTTSRLTRKPRENEDLIELAESHGISYQYVRSPAVDLNTAAGRRYARWSAANDAGEAEETAERVARAKLQAATQGKFRGGRRPFGFEPDGVTLREAEAAEIRHATEQALAGVSLAGIARDLNARRVATSTGKAWTGREVGRLLARARNAGLVERHGEILGPAQWPAIVDEGTWRAVRAMLADPGRLTTPGPTRRWLLSGIAKCGVCGSGVLVTSTRNRAGGRWPVYTCRPGRHVARACEQVDALVNDLVVARLSRPDAVDLLAVDAGVDVGELHRTAAGLRARLDELAGLFARGVVDARQLERGTTDLRAQLETVEGQLAAAASKSVFHGVVDVDDVGEVWAGLSLERRRAVVSALVEVTILKARRGRTPGWRPGAPYWDPESVRVEWRR
jgi:site-specific DNA recombinase